MRSSATNTPTSPASSSSSSVKYWRTRSEMLRDAITASTVSSAVSHTIGSDRPSTPRWNEVPSPGIQARLNSNCIAALAPSNDTHTAVAIISTMPDSTSATGRASRSARSGMSEIPIPPTRGRMIIAASR